MSAAQEQIPDGLDLTADGDLTRQVLGPGDATRNPELASVLRRLAAEGTEPLYRGDLARQVADTTVDAIAAASGGS